MGSKATVVEVHDVSKRFVIRKEKSLKERIVNFGRSNLHKEDFWALRNIDLDIETGTSVGLIGPNGSGKSTLLKTIGGILQPTSGTVRTRGRMAALLELGAGFHPDLTGRENVFLNASILGLSTQETEKYFDAIVDFSGIEQFIDTQVKFYSSGMYVRLAFAVAVHVDPDVLLLHTFLSHPVHLDLLRSCLTHPVCLDLDPDPDLLLLLCSYLAHPVQPWTCCCIVSLHVMCPSLDLLLRICLAHAPCAGPGPGPPATA